MRRGFKCCTLFYSDCTCIQPVLSESSLTLALALTENQLTNNSSDISLVVAIVGFLAQVANAAKMSATNKDMEDLAYTKEQVCYHCAVKFLY